MTMFRFRGDEEESQKKKAAITMCRFMREETQEEILTSVRLRVRINEVIGCDQGCSDFDPLRPNKGKKKMNTEYYVTLWVDPDNINETQCVSPKKLPNGSSHLTWYIPATTYSEAIAPEIFDFELNPETYESEELKLEVIRTDCYGEIGTSNGNVVVGRATIKMSKVSKEAVRCHNVDLTRTMVESLECRMEGKIIMDMKVELITRPVRPWYYGIGN